MLVIYEHLNILAMFCYNLHLVQPEEDWPPLIACNGCREGDSVCSGQMGDSGSTEQAGAPVGRRRRDSLVRGAATGGLVCGGGTG